MPPRHLKITEFSNIVLDTDLCGSANIQILEHLAQRGHQVQLVAMNSKDPSTASFRGINILSFRLRAAALFQRLCFQVILAFFLPIHVLTQKPQIVITEPDLSILSFFWKPILTRCTKVKVILDVRSVPVETSCGWRAGLMAFLFSVSMLVARRLFDGITTVTPMMKEDLVEQFSISDPRFIRVWTNGVTNSLFDPSKYAEDAARLRKENGVDKDAFVVFYHGSFTEHRGIYESVRSIKNLTGKYDDVVLFMLGSGVAVPSIRKLIRNLGLEGRVIIHDPVWPYSEVPKYIAMSDVCLVPYPNIADWRHQFILKLIEYLAMEKPVIVTDIPCVRFVVDDSKCALYISDADPTLIAQAVMNYHDRRNTLAQLGQDCKKIAEKYDWSRVAESLENDLLSIIAQN